MKRIVVAIIIVGAVCAYAQVERRALVLTEEAVRVLVETGYPPNRVVNEILAEVSEAAQDEIAAAIDRLYVAPALAAATAAKIEAASKEERLRTARVAATPTPTPSPTPTSRPERAEEPVGTGR